MDLRDRPRFPKRIEKYRIDEIMDQRPGMYSARATHDLSGQRQPFVYSLGMADFHLDVLGTAGTKVIFRTNHPDSRRVAGFIRAPKGVDLAARIEQLAVGHAYIQTPDMKTGSITHMAPPRTV